VLFDYDLEKHLSLVRKQAPVLGNQNLLHFDYSMKSSFTAGGSSSQGTGTNTSANTGEVKKTAHEFIIEDENYFGGQSIIRKASDNNFEEEGHSSQ